MTDLEIKAAEKAYAIENAKEEVLRISNLMADYAETLKNKAAEIGVPNKIGNSTVEDSTKMSWIVNDIENLLRNINFSRLVTAAVRVH